MIRYRSLTREEKENLKIERLQGWHKWFAWHPVRMTFDRHEVRFFGYIYRKGKRRHSENGFHWNWKYAETEFDILKIEDEKNNEE